MAESSEPSDQRLLQPHDDTHVAVGSDGLGDTETRRWTAIGIAAAVAVFWLIGTAGNPLRLFDDPRAVTSNFFDIQARSLLQGRLSAPPGSYLIEEFVTPQGSHMYFGIVPALLRVPLLLLDLGLTGRLTLFSCLAAVVVAGLSSARLGRRAQSLFTRQHSPLHDASPRWFALIAAAPVLFSPALFLASRSFIYNEAILWGVATSLWGLDVALQWWYRGRRSDAWCLIAACAVAVNSRPSVGLIPALTVSMLVVILITRRQWAKAGMGVLSVGVALGSFTAINFARFRQIWGPPHALQESNKFNPVQQAAVALTDGTLFSPRFALTNAWSYFIPSTGGVHLTRLFPFVEFGEAPQPFLSAPMLLSPTGSLITSAPALVVLALGGAWVLCRRGDAAWRVAAIASLVSSVVTLGFWAVAHRYLSDFVPLLMVLSVIGLWGLCEHLAASSAARRRVIGAGLIAVLATGTLAQTGLALAGRYFYIFPDVEERVSAIDFRYSLDQRLFDSAPPNVVRIPVSTPISELPTLTQSEVLVVGECDGIYTPVFGLHAIERRSGGALRVIVSPAPDLAINPSSAPNLIASGDGWTLRTESPTPNGELAVVYSRADGSAVRGAVRLDANPIRLDIVADPFSTQFQVFQDGRPVIDLLGESSRGLVIGQGWDLQTASAPTCDSILKRK